MFKLLKLRSLDYQLVSSVSQQQAQALATLQSVQYKCQIINNILNIHLSQNFVSKSDTEYSETIYYFPIEEGICLESFEAKYNEKTIKAIVKEKDQAKKEYQENKSQGNFVSYAQTTSVNDQDYCKIELGNLPPGQQVEINIVFSQQLNSLLNKYFVAHIPLIYCDDEVSAKLGKNFLTLDLFCTGKILYAESKGYPVEKIMLDDNTARFNLSQALLQQNTNFQLIFSYEGMFNPQVIFGSSKIFNEDSVKSAILPASHSAMVSFIPNFNEDITQEIDDSIRAAISNGDDIFSDEFQQKLNQELVDHLNSSRSEFIFLLDRSGSMSGQPIRRACEALTLFLKSLPNDSYFNVISFGSSFEKLFPSSIKYTSDSLEKAVYLISKYQADLGGTEIYNPLNNVFVQNRIQGYNKQIFLLTDGEVDSPQSVVRLIKKNSKFNRVHSIGFGSGADQYLIKESAIAGKGISKLVDQKCDLSEAIINMLSLCITPTFDDFKISYDESVFDSTFPSCTSFPCVFKDEIISIHFFFKPLLELQNLTEQQKKILIEYYDSHKKLKVQKEIKLEMQDSFTCNPQLQQAVFKIGKQLYLNENILDEKSNSQLTQQAIDYQLLTKKTALICVIETLNDEQKIMYQHLNHYKTYQNSQQIYEQNSQSLKCNLPSTPKKGSFQSNISQGFQYDFISNQQNFDIFSMFGDPAPPPPSFNQFLSAHSSLNQNYNSSIIGAPVPPSQSLCQNVPLPPLPANFGSFNTTSVPAPPSLGGGGFGMNPMINAYQPSSASFGNNQNKIQQQQQQVQQSFCHSSHHNSNFIPQSIENECDDLLDFDGQEQNLQEECIQPEVQDCSKKDLNYELSYPYIQRAMSPSNAAKDKQQKEFVQINQLIQKQADEIKSQHSSLEKLSNNSQISLPKLEDLLNLVNSQGIWKFDESLVMKISKIDQYAIKQLCSQFACNDAFMTLFVLIILEMNYGQQKPKWVLISKKSLSYVKSQLNEGKYFNSAKQNIQSLISN
ncbi:hypothetical protein ABPG72_015911 [Tetrahymena utriculariae]